MKNKTKDHNPFQGSWVITRTQQKNRNDRWVTLRRFHFKDYTWLFCQERRIDFEGTGCSYEGKLKDSFTGSQDYVTGYSFFTQDAELYIDRSDYCDDGFMWACLNDIYRVIANGNTLTLYDIADFGDTPDDYLVRIVLKRDTLKNRLIENIKAVFLPRISYYKAGSLL